MKIFIISMKSYKERREFQIRQAKQLNLNITFIDAINGADLSTKELQNAESLTRPISFQKRRRLFFISSQSVGRSQ